MYMVCTRAYACSTGWTGTAVEAAVEDHCCSGVGGLADLDA